VYARESSWNPSSNTMQPVLSQHVCPVLVFFPNSTFISRFVVSFSKLLNLKLHNLGVGVACGCVCVFFYSLFKVYVMPFLMASIIYNWIRGWLVYCELEKMCREAVVAWCVVLSWNLCGKQERDVKPVITATL